MNATPIAERYDTDLSLFVRFRGLVDIVRDYGMPQAYLSFMNLFNEIREKAFSIRNTSNLAF